MVDLENTLRFYGLAISERAVKFDLAFDSGDDKSRQLLTKEFAAFVMQQIDLAVNQMRSAQEAVTSAITILLDEAARQPHIMNLLQSFVDVFDRTVREVFEIVEQIGFRFESIGAPNPMSAAPAIENAIAANATAEVQNSAPQLGTESPELTIAENRRNLLKDCAGQILRLARRYAWHSIRSRKFLSAVEEL